MPDIEGHGWELKVTRLGLQHRADQVPPVRTYSAYQLFIDGEQAPLAGHICERTGPGDNTKNGVHKHLRIHEGRYRLRTHFGTDYRSVGFGMTSDPPRPGIGVLDTGARTFILLHPGHPPHLYVSSIGCLNPTKPLTDNALINFAESRDRVIALLDSLKAHDPAPFAHDKVGTPTPIADAWLVVDGEPMGPVSGPDTPVG